MALLFGAALASWSGVLPEAWAAEPAGKVWTNSIGMEFVQIPAGEFVMGGLLPAGKKADPYMEAQKPAHRVRITQPFYMGRHEVTQSEWVAVMETNPSYAAPGTLRWKPEMHARAAADPARYDEWRRPVERVSWEEAQEFVRRLNAREGTQRYRLPTEAEWEYAARAGSSKRYAFGDDVADLSRYAWYGWAMIDDNSPVVSADGGVGVGAAMPVGLREPNAWGLFDMLGNVMEWCGDWFDPAYYARSPEADPQGPAEGVGFELRGEEMPPMRVLRGGSFNDGRGAELMVVSVRVAGAPDAKDDTIGFRLVYAAHGGIQKP